MTQIEMDAYRSQIRAHNAITNTLSNTDWEQRRYELAKAALTGIAESGTSEEWIAFRAVRLADAVIKELRKNETKN